MSVIGQYKGFSLMHVLMGLALSAFIVIAAVQSLASFHKFQQRAIATATLKSRVDSLGIALKKLLEGTKSFQNLCFRVPSTGLRSFKAGFVVSSNVDVDGNALPDNDRIFLVSKMPLLSTVTLAQDYSAGLALQANNPAANIFDLFAANDYLVVTNGRTSEMLQLPQVTPSLVTNLTSVPAFPGPTFSEGATAPGFIYTYVSGDYAHKAEIFTLGVRPEPSGTYELVQVQERTGQTLRRLDRGLTFFAISYRLLDDEIACKGIPARVFERSQWGVLESSDDNVCYERVGAIKVDFALLDEDQQRQDPTGPQRKVFGSYVFRVR